MDRIELEKILLDKNPVGPYKRSDWHWTSIQTDDWQETGFQAILESLGPNLTAYDWPNDPPETQLNRAYQLGRWVERSESEPPMGKASDYQPICKFCGEMVDEMVTVYFKQSAQRMCVKCMNDRSHRKL